MRDQYMTKQLGGAGDAVALPITLPITKSIINENA